MNADSKFKDWRDLYQDSEAEVRDYTKNSTYVYKPDAARFKMVVWFKDGKTRYFYSFDNKHRDKDVITDEYEGLCKLLRLAHSYKGKYKNILLYCSLDPGKSITANYNVQIAKFDIFGNTKTNKFVNFISIGSNVVLDIKRMETYSMLKL